MFKINDREAYHFIHTIVYISENYKVHSFSKAAHELGYAQSTVTMQIRLLEEELGMKLLDRLGHHISLTSEGNKLLPIAD